ncbi:MAG: homoprotocatechuate degradation operon regulator HpaR [Janthinobacterium lividum]
MPYRITHRNLPQLFLKARDALMAHFRPILNHFGVTEQQWRILRALDEHGQLEPRELCELCQILSPSMAGVLARMEELGLVARERMAADARRVTVRLGEKGDRLIDEIAPLIEQQYRLMEQTWGKHLVDGLTDALEGFIAAQETAVPQVALPPGGRRGQQADE